MGTENRKKALRNAVLALIAVCALCYCIVRGIQTGTIPPPDPGPRSPDAQKHEHVWEDGVCVICGEECVHLWRSGVCTICGEECVHVWQSGVCTICAYACPHTDHDPETLICADCGETAEHRYVDLVCSCGAVPQFITDPSEFPEDVLDGSEQKGTLQTFVYDTRDGSVTPDAKREYKTQREFVVYTPYGYDPEERYNVLVLLHGAGQDCHEWLERRHIFNVSYPFFYGTDLLDAMIERGECEPLIVVSTEYRYFGTPAEVSGPYSRELREGILPYIVENYPTYASLDPEGRLVPAREHFAFSAASFGSMIMWGGMIESCGDIFAYWGGYSGNVTTTEDMVAELNAAGDAGYAPLMIYAGGGSLEESSYSDQRRFAQAVEQCDYLSNGNAVYHFIKDREHAYSTWDMCLYNSLLVFYRNSHEA